MQISKTARIIGNDDELVKTIHSSLHRSNDNALVVEGAICKESDDDLLSHGNPHYHRRKVVSLSCSGWEGVGPTRYGRQTNC